MINLSRKRCFEEEIRCFSMIIGSYILKEKSSIDGWYEVDTMFDNETIRLVTIDEAHTPLIVNGHHLRLYHRPVSKDCFIKHLSDNSSFEIVSPNNSSSATLV